MYKRKLVFLNNIQYAMEFFYILSFWYRDVQSRIWLYINIYIEATENQKLPTGDDGLELVR